MGSDLSKSCRKIRYRVFPPPTRALASISEARTSIVRQACGAAQTAFAIQQQFCRSTLVHLVESAWNLLVPNASVEWTIAQFFFPSVATP